MYLASPLTVAASAVAGYIVEYEPAGQRASRRESRASNVSRANERAHAGPQRPWLPSRRVFLVTSKYPLRSGIADIGIAQGDTVLWPM